MKNATTAVLSAIAMFAALGVSSVADEPAGQVVNNPSELWGGWGPAKFDVAADPQVSMFRRVTVSAKPAQPWDIGVWNKIVKPVQKGDVLLVSITARAQKTPAGSDFIVTNSRVVEVGPAALGVSPDTTLSIGASWKQYYVWGTATKDYPPGSIQVTVLVGGDVQTLDLGPVTVTDLGPGYDLTKLPQN